MDTTSRRMLADSLVPGLREQGVVAVATSFVDNSGIARVKTVPVDRLPHLAAWGVGFPSVVDYLRFDDWIVAPLDHHGPVGDLRIVPDLRRLVTLVAHPGWAWAPGELYRQDGEPHEKCSRMLLRRQVDALAEQGFEVRATFELEWVVSMGRDAEEFAPAAGGPAYGLARLGGVSSYARDLLDASLAQGVRVDQFHPEYPPGQLELSVQAESPVDAADTSVLVRSTIRSVGERHGYRTSFAPKVDPDGLGNGGHVHLSLWRDGRNLMTGGSGNFGLTDTGAAFVGGILRKLPALMAIGAPSVASYLRLMPSCWAGVFACWGLENREAALRMIPGTTGTGTWAANVEVRCFDLTANPYLVLAALLAAGSAGIRDRPTLPDPVDIDPAALPEEVLQKRGIRRLPTSLRDAVDALAQDETLRDALGSPLLDSLLAVRQSEIDLFADAPPDQVVKATRWVH